jgi:hypothetical protein
MAIPPYRLFPFYYDQTLNNLNLRFTNSALVKESWSGRTPTGNNEIMQVSRTGNTDPFLVNRWVYPNFPVTPFSLSGTTVEPNNGNLIVNNPNAAPFNPYYARLTIPFLWHFGTWWMYYSTPNILTHPFPIPNLIATSRTYAREPKHFFGEVGYPLACPKAVMISYTEPNTDVDTGIDQIAASDFFQNLAAAIGPYLDAKGIFLGDMGSDDGRGNVVVLPNANRYLCGEVLVIHYGFAFGMDQNNQLTDLAMAAAVKLWRSQVQPFSRFQYNYYVNDTPIIDAPFGWTNGKGLVKSMMSGLPNLKVTDGPMTMGQAIADIKTFFGE